MTLLPIVERELRVVARRPSTQWFRFIAASVALIMLLLFRATAARSDTGKGLFITMSIVAFAGAILAGVFLTADALSGEKRAGTIGLLFLTDLRGYDVVLGKLAVSSVHAFFALMAVFPILGMPLLMGGVTGGEFFRVMGALMVTLCFSLAAGLLISAMGRETRQVTLGTVLVILLFAGFSPVVYSMLKSFSSAWVPHYLIWLSPGGCLSLAFDEAYAGGPFRQEYWWSMTLILGVAVVFLVAASYILPCAWQEKQRVLRLRLKPAQLVQLRPASGNSRLTRRYLMDIDPFLWLGARDKAAQRLAWLAASLMLPLVLFFVLGSIFGLKNLSFEWRMLAWIGLLCGFASHLFIKYLIAFEASRRLSEDRASGALELLLSSPVSETQVLGGLRRSLKLQFGNPVRWIVLGNLVLALLVISRFNELEMHGSDIPMFILMFVGGAVLLVMDCWALSWMGQWRGLRAKNPNRAVVGALGRVLGLPWLGLALMIFSISQRLSEVIALASWMIFGSMVALAVGTHARDRASRGIRSALEHPESVR